MRRVQASSSVSLYMYIHGQPPCRSCEKETSQRQVQSDSAEILSLCLYLFGLHRGFLSSLFRSLTQHPSNPTINHTAGSVRFLSGHIFTSYDMPRRVSQQKVVSLDSRTA